MRLLPPNAIIARESRMRYVDRGGRESAIEALRPRSAARSA